MGTFKQVGVWVDYGRAIVVGYEKGQVHELENILSPVETHKREQGEGNDTTRFTPHTDHVSNNEYRKNNIAQNEVNEYLKLLENKLQPYNELLIFGPGTAKEQLRNRLKQNKSYDGKWLQVQNSDKMTPNQLLAYVRDFYDSNGVG